jgi:hypothetical protein
LKFKVPLVIEGESTYQVSVTSGTSGYQDFTETYNFYSPKVRLSANCELKAWRRERYKPSTEVYKQFADFSGNVHIVNHGSPVQTASADTFFNAQSIAATLTVKQKPNHEWGTGYSCTKVTAPTQTCSCPLL